MSRGARAAVESLLARAGIGQFAGNPELPQALDQAVRGQALTVAGQLGGDPGLRLASSRGRRTYRGGGLFLQTFIGGNGGPATDDVLAALPTKRNQRRALGTFRGVPEAPTFTPPEG